MSLYLGNTPIANTGYDKANTDLSNLTNAGKNIANWSNNVTNCITKIPQDIKVGLNNGGLYLKDGCKYCVPNGFEQDGVTPRFDFVTITGDTVPLTYGAGRTGCLAVWSSAGHFEWSTPNSFFSGSTQPSGSWWIWYDTTTNKIKHYNGSTVVDGVSFPICMITENAGTGYDSTVKSIDQVFNGFGYIGSTIFALPGVEGLAPNGRNADGSLKSTAFTVSKVVTLTSPSSITQQYMIALSGNSMWRLTVNNCWYDEEHNGYWNGSVNGYQYNFICPILCKITSGVVSNFTAYRYIHVPSWQDASGLSMPSTKYINLTLGASGATYTAPANGWFVFDKAASAANQYAALYNTGKNNLIKSIAQTVIPVASNIGLTIPALKGDTIHLDYTLAGNTIAWRFVYAEGDQ